MTNALNLRIGIEQAICRRVVNELLCHKYHLAVDSGDLDIEDIVTCQDIPHLLQGNNGLFNFDDAYLLVYKAPKKDGSDRKADYFVRIVFGNDGYDVISDYSTGLEKHLENSLRLSKVCEELPIEMFENAVINLDMKD